tara:strand:+ start:2721 stop:3104 length:384 start_codon:yes stop_codon:yes gene_type:complete
MDHAFEKIQNQEHSPETPPSIESVDEAEEFIANRLESGDMPVVTVPKEYADALENGLDAHTTWIPDLKIISATLGRDPYLPDEDRVVVRIKDINVEHVHPRFTGPDKHFHGVVTLEGPISPEAIEII